MAGGNSDIEFIKKGKLDGRKPDELREVRIEVGVLNRADGSCYLEWGNNKVYVGVFGPIECHPRHKQLQDRAIVQARYTMAPFSVNDRKRPGYDRRSSEISYIISQALERVVMVAVPACRHPGGHAGRRSARRHPLRSADGGISRAG